MILLLFIAVAFSFCACRYWLRMEFDASTPANQLRDWVIKGLAFPTALWALVNLGLSQHFPAFVPQIVDAQQHHRPWLGFWFDATFSGAATVGFCWSAITLMWLYWIIIVRSQDKAELFVTSTLIGCVSGAFSLLLIYFLGPIGLPAAIAILLLPVVHFTTHHAELFIPQPSYSKAVARMKFGKYAEAEWAVINELEKSDKDFEGWMILADLYANNYRKMEDTAQVILDICNDPNSQPIQISLACHKLADWQLSIWDNPDGARAALELLCRKLPDTHFARMARQRIASIPFSELELAEQKKPRPIQLPTLREDFNPPNSGQSRVATATAKSEAERLVEKLTADPNDLVARERLANLLAEQLEMPQSGIDQLQLLVDLADPSDEQKGKWLAQIATWELHFNRNPERFRTVLRQIIHDYPQTSHAFAAQRRLYLMEMDAQLLDKPV